MISISILVSGFVIASFFCQTMLVSKQVAAGKLSRDYSFHGRHMFIDGNLIISINRSTHDLLIEALIDCRLLAEWKANMTRVDYSNNYPEKFNSRLTS